MLALAAASYSNTLGIGRALDALPLAAIQRLEGLWSANDGEGDFRLRADGGSGGDDGEEVLSPSVLCSTLAARLRVLTHWAAARISWKSRADDRHDDLDTSSLHGSHQHRHPRPDGPPPLVVTSDDGRTLEAAAVVVAVPVTILQRGLLQFSPPLPTRKREAIGSIRVAPACKVILTFSSPPWSSSSAATRSFAAHPVHSILSTGTLLPEVWFTTGPSGTWIASGFATGDFATEVAKQAEEGQTAEGMLCQLSAMLSSIVSERRDRLSSESDEGHARLCSSGPMLSALRSRLRDSRVVNWEANPWILGGYSCPTFAELPGARATYREPVCDGRVAFAGEATEESMMTMNAAIESGRRAAREVRERLLGGPGRRTVGEDLDREGGGTLLANADVDRTGTSTVAPQHRSKL
jgi:hypothetical protein